MGNYVDKAGLTAALKHINTKITSYLPLTGGSVTGKTYFSYGNYVKSFTTSVTDKYFHICTITINIEYINQPIIFYYVQRGNYGKTVVWFKSQNSQDPELMNFFSSGYNANNTYLVKTSSGIWDLYIKKTEKYDSLTITQLEFGDYYKKVYITWASDELETLPSGYVTSTTESVTLSSSNATNSTYATKLGSSSSQTSVGSAQNPVYFSGGVPTLCSVASDGDTKPYKKLAFISSSGVTELGKYIDFHNDNTTGSDYSLRLQITGNYSNAVNLPSTSGTLALTTDIPTTYAGSSSKGGVAWSSSRLTDNGTITLTQSGTTCAKTGGLRYTSSGMWMDEIYNTSYSPTMYGNMINMLGTGSSQLVLGWEGTDTKTGHLYYRSHRDTSTGGWGAWNTILDSANYTSWLGSTTAFGVVKVGSNISVSGGTISLTKANVISALGFTPESTNTNYYHTGGGWSGLKYTLTGQGGASNIDITIPTGTSSSTVALGNHTHDNQYLTLDGGTLEGPIYFSNECTDDDVLNYLKKNVTIDDSDYEYYSAHIIGLDSKSNSDYYSVIVTIHYSGINPSATLTWLSELDYVVKYDFIPYYNVDYDVTEFIGIIPISSAIINTPQSITKYKIVTDYGPTLTLNAYKTNVVNKTMMEDITATIPAASTTSYGVIKVGSGLSVAEGVLSANVTSDNDYRVQQKPCTTANDNYELLFSGNANNNNETTTVNKNSNAKINPSTGTITATRFVGTLSGNASTATTASKLGTATVGTAYNPIYLKEGVATRIDGTVGKGGKTITYLDNGYITYSTTTLGSVTQPVYLYKGVLRQCNSMETSIIPLHTFDGLSSTTNTYLLNVQNEEDPEIYLKYTYDTPIQSSVVSNLCYTLLGV